MIAINKSDFSTSEMIDFLKDNVKNRVVWTLLAFQAGWINSGGFLATHRFVTHITGFATQFGYDLSQLKFVDAISMLSVPMFFLAGTMISAYYVDRPIHLGKKPQFHILFFLISSFLIIVTGLGSFGGLGNFGQPMDIASSYVLIALLCLSSGIQNAGTTTASNSFVRTTHLTGITTDLGIGLVRRLTQKKSEKRDHEARRNHVRLWLIAGFVLGSLLGSVLFMNFGFIGFIIPTFISIILFCIAKKEHRRNA